MTTKQEWVDDYHTNMETRMKRSKGVQELYDLVDDIRYCISRSKTIGNNRMSKWYNHRQYNKMVRNELECYDKQEDIPYLHIAVQHQAYNDCLERLIEK